MGGHNFRKGRFIVITHKFALVCAEVLRDYCEENFLISKENVCTNCVFSRKVRTPNAIHSSVCNLEAFITGRYGKEHQKEITEQVENRLKELKNGT